MGVVTDEHHLAIGLRADRRLEAAHALEARVEVRVRATLLELGAEPDPQERVLAARAEAPVREEAAQLLGAEPGTPGLADLCSRRAGVALVLLAHDRRGDPRGDELVAMVERRARADRGVVRPAGLEQVLVDGLCVGHRDDLHAPRDLRVADAARPQAPLVEHPEQVALVGLPLRQQLGRSLLEDHDAGLAVEHERRRDPEHVAGHVAGLHEVRPALDDRAAQQPLDCPVAGRPLQVQHGRVRRCGRRGRPLAAELRLRQLAELPRHADDTGSVARGRQGRAAHSIAAKGARGTRSHHASPRGPSPCRALGPAPVRRPDAIGSPSTVATSGRPAPGRSGTTRGAHPAPRQALGRQGGARPAPPRVAAAPAGAREAGATEQLAVEVPVAVRVGGRVDRHHPTAGPHPAARRPRAAILPAPRAVRLQQDDDVDLAKVLEGGGIVSDLGSEAVLERLPAGLDRLDVAVGGRAREDEHVGLRVVATATGRDRQREDRGANPHGRRCSPGSPPGGGRGFRA